MLKQEYIRILMKLITLYFKHLLVVKPSHYYLLKSKYSRDVVNQSNLFRILFL